MAKGPRIVIVGGGITGLTVALRLLTEAKAAGRTLEITVLEARDRVGGMCIANKVNGRTVEHGSHGFFGSGDGYYVNSVALTKELGTYASLYKVPAWTVVNGDGRRATMGNTRWLPRLLDTVPGLLRIPWLSFMGKLRMIWASFRLWRIPHRKYRPLDELNGYDLGRRKGYDHAGAMSWNMASLGLTNQFVDGDPAYGDPGLSGALFAGKHRVLLGSKNGLSYLIASGDLSDVLANPLAARVTELGATIRLKTKAAAIDRAAKTVTLADGEELGYDELVLAVQPWHAAKLVTWAEPRWKELKPTSPVIMITLQLSGRIAGSLDGRELGLSRKDWPFSVITDLSRFWPEFAPATNGDKTVLRVEIGHADRPPGESAREVILAEVKAGLDKLWPECAAMTVDWAELVHEKELLYVAWLRGEWQKQPTPAERAAAPDVFLAGDWTSKGVIGMEAAVNSALETVNWIHARHGWAQVKFAQVPLG